MIELLIILTIVAVLFGTKRLRDIGEDLGGAIRGFKNAMNTGETEGREPERGSVEQIERREPGESSTLQAETEAKETKRSAGSESLTLVSDRDRCVSCVTFGH